MGFLLRQRSEKRPISNFFAIPGVQTNTIKLDFLHIMDLGVSQDWAGSLLFYLMEYKVPGDSRVDRCTVMYQSLKAYYAVHPEIDSKLPKLLPTMLRFEDQSGKKKSPKLRRRVQRHHWLVA